MARKTCPAEQKPRFPSQLEAEIAKADIHRSNNHNRHRKFREEPSRVYPCTHCGGWHLTSKS